MTPPPSSGVRLVPMTAEQVERLEYEARKHREMASGNRGDPKQARWNLDDAEFYASLAAAYEEGITEEEAQILWPENPQQISSEAVHHFRSARNKLRTAFEDQEPGR